MGILYMVVIPLVSFLTLIFIINTILKTTSSKFRNMALRLKLMLLMGLSHFILIAVPCFIFMIKNNSDPEAIMGFLFCFIIDFIFWPLYIWLLEILIPIFSLKISNIVAPFVVFGILGTLFYCCLGWLLGDLITKKKRKGKRKGDASI